MRIAFLAVALLALTGCASTTYEPIFVSRPASHNCVPDASGRYFPLVKGPHCEKFAQRHHARRAHGVRADAARGHARHYRNPRMGSWF